MGILAWAKTAASNALVGSINFQEGQAPSTINDSARALMADVAKYRDDIGGALDTTGAAGVYAVSTNGVITSLVSGISLRIKANHTSPGASTFNADATGAKKILVIDDSGERDLAASELDANAFYDLAYDPDADSSTGAWVLVGASVESLDTSNFALKIEAEGTIASGATCDIGAETEYRLNVTGTTTITSFGTTVNSRKLLRFSDVATLTHHATTLILPSGANIATAAGDIAEFASDGLGNWRCVDYQRADGTALVGADTSSIEADLTELERVLKNRVVNHITSATLYAYSTDREILALETAITNVAADNHVKLQATISLECHHDNVIYIERNGTEILGAAVAGSRNVGLVSAALDNDHTTTMANMSFTVVDEAPDTGTNTYTFHMRGTSGNPLGINRTISDPDSASGERTTSTIILEELAQ